MNSIDDSSLISGIANLSRISKTSSSNLYKLDSTSNVLELRSSCKDLSRNFLYADSQKNESKRISENSKANKALSICEESLSEYAKLLIIYKCIEELIDDSNPMIDKTLNNKLHEIFKLHKIKKFMHLPSNSNHQLEEQTLLGIIDLAKIEFSYEEKISIRSFLETKLRDKIHIFLAKFESQIGPLKDILKNNESKFRSRFLQKGELENLHWKEKIDEVCLEFQNDLLNYHKIFEKWIELKNKICDKNIKDAENLQLQAEIAETKAIITKLTCSVRFYKETPVTIEALKILNNTLEEKIYAATEEISHKKELKKAYEDLSSTAEYNEILRQYLEVCNVLEKKKSLYDKL